jgi:hypothetical protein
MIRAGQVWPIASAWLDGIVAGLGKNTPRMHDMINSPIAVEDDGIRALAETSGFQGRLDYTAGRVGPGRAASRFHFAEKAHST